jgi:hypothetical protein
LSVQESVDRADQDSSTATEISQLCRADVVLAIRNRQRYGGKPIQYLITGFRFREALQKLLKEEAGRKDRPIARTNARTGIDEKTQSRLRSAL